MDDMPLLAYTHMIRCYKDDCRKRIRCILWHEHDTDEGTIVPNLVGGIGSVAGKLCFELYCDSYVEERRPE